MRSNARRGKFVAVLLYVIYVNDNYECLLEQVEKDYASATVQGIPGVRGYKLEYVV